MSLALATSARVRAPVAARPAKVSAKSRRAAVIVKAAAEPAETSARFASRREALLKGAALTAGLVANVAPALADALPEETDVPLLCNAECEAALAEAPLSPPSGLQYKDIVVGDGAQPEVGFQCVVHYIAKNEKGQIFDNSSRRASPTTSASREIPPPTSSPVSTRASSPCVAAASGGCTSPASSRSPRDSPPHPDDPASRHSPRWFSTSSSSTSQAWSDLIARERTERENAASAPRPSVDSR